MRTQNGNEFYRPLRSEPDDLFSSRLQSGPDLPASSVPEKDDNRSHVQFTYPAPKHALGDIQITGSLRNRHAPIGHQPYCLVLELAAELPSCHKALQFMGHDPIFVSTKPAAAQKSHDAALFDAKNVTARSKTPN
jgi:hypothetical protein